MKRQNKQSLIVFSTVLVFVGGALMKVRVKTADRKRAGALGKKTKVMASARYRKMRSVDPMTASFSASVADAIHHAKMRGNPVARYDRAAKRSYLEYPDGSRVYRDEA